MLSVFASMRIVFLSLVLGDTPFMLVSGFRGAVCVLHSRWLCNLVSCALCVSEFVLETVNEGGFMTSYLVVVRVGVI